MIYDRIMSVLDKLAIPFDEIVHEASASCEHSRELREKAGLSGAGSKNIVFHAKGNFYLVTTIGDKDIKARRFKKEFGTKDIRFASQEEITTLELGTIGSIPPFGSGNEQVPVFVDMEIFAHEYFMFNPGDPCKTIRLKTTDLRNIYRHMKNPVTFFTTLEEETNFVPNSEY